MDDKRMLNRSTILIHFITNSVKCYVKIRNIKTGLYMKINRLSNTSEYLNADNNIINAVNFSTIGDPTIIGDNDGTVLILNPTYINSQTHITIADNGNIYDDYNTQGNIDIGSGCSELNLTTLKNSSILKVSSAKDIETMFKLNGTLDETYICSCSDMENMFGGYGRYLYMTDDGYIHSDGDPSIDSSKWQIEKINSYIPRVDIRTDYEKQYIDVVKESKKNVDILFPNMLKYFTFQNVAHDKYMCISLDLGNIYENELYGDDEKMKFIIRPCLLDNCVYISYYCNGTMMNVYNIPNRSNVHIGAPECDWAKFYIIRRNNHYMFQIFDRVADSHGHIGKYLRMDVNKNILSDGCEYDDDAKWDIKNIV